MTEFEERMRSELRRLEALLKILKQEQRKTSYYSNDYLEVREYKGRKYYTLVSQGSRGLTKHYFGSHEDFSVIKVKIRKFLEAEIHRVTANIECLRMMIRDYQDIDPHNVLLDLPRAYRDVPDYCYELLGYEPRSIGTDPIGNRFHDEEKQHRTRRGEMVRSKNEVIIANELDLKGIPYAYEKPLVINGRVYYPDFTIISPRTGRVVIWEHFGRLDDPKYYNDFVEKVKMYIGAGYVPGVDLIMTFDLPGKGIDVFSIDRIIDAYLAA